MGKLLCVMGNSGSGKTSTMRMVLDNEIVSDTTREIRPGEVNGRDYYFITKEEFEYRLNKGLYCEYSDYYGRAYYGSLWREVVRKLAKGTAFVICDYHGFEQFCEKLGNDIVVPLFILNSEEESVKAMLMRGESMDFIKKRLTTHRQELENALKHPEDYTIWNKWGKQKETIEKVKEFIDKVERNLL